MHKAKVNYRGEGKYLLVLQRIHGWSSDGIPMCQDKTEKLLTCVEQALEHNFDANDLSGGDFCRFIGLGLNSHFLLSLNLSDIMYKGYDLSVHQVKLLRASLKNVLAEATKE